MQGGFLGAQAFKRAQAHVLKVRRAQAQAQTLNKAQVALQRSGPKPSRALAQAPKKAQGGLEKVP